MSSSEHSTCYCIIGAGAAVLAALKELTDAGIAIDCFEKTNRVAWHLLRVIVLVLMNAQPSRNKLLIRYLN